MLRLHSVPCRYRVKVKRVHRCSLMQLPTKISDLLHENHCLMIPNQSPSLISVRGINQVRVILLMLPLSSSSSPPAYSTIFTLLRKQLKNPRDKNQLTSEFSNMSALSYTESGMSNTWH
ncbi:hypothetical protein ILYODFUR_021959 [Ilyodon furcidens]|uniref:Uncharacterized protein n=1 Tax=Ilyodon furcidens TaxID=33524 RepID=A0ABV0TD21_9TELE